MLAPFTRGSELARVKEVLAHSQDDNASSSSRTAGAYGGLRPATSAIRSETQAARRHCPDQAVASMTVLDSTSVAGLRNEDRLGAGHVALTAAM